MSRTLTVVPFRGTPTAKSRLSARFAAQQRERIARYVMLHVLREIAGSGVVDHVLVVTADREALAMPIELADRATVLRQLPGRAGLNAAIELGREAAVAGGYQRLLAVLPDLPLLRSDEIRCVLEDDAAVVLASDRHGTGTNALAIDLVRTTPAGTVGFAFGFGEQSAIHHRAEAYRLGIAPAVVVADGLRHDLDTPDDWDALPADTRRELLAALRVPAVIARSDE